MKLIFCPACHDLFRLRISLKPKSCICALSWGRYKKDGRTAIIGGLAVPIGIDNKSFMKAVKQRTKTLPTSHNDFMHFTVAYPFEAFVIPVICATVKDDK